MLAAVDLEDDGVIGVGDGSGMGKPRRVGSGGALVFVLSRWWSVCRGEFGDGGAGAGFVDDGFSVGEGGEEGVDGDVVDDAGVAAAGLVDEGDRVVGERSEERRVVK